MLNKIKTEIGLVIVLVKMTVLAKVNLVKRRLAWLLIGKALLFRLDNLQKTMDITMAKVKEIDAMDAIGQARFEEERKTWMELYWRYYELEVEVSGFVEYLRG